MRRAFIVSEQSWLWLKVPATDTEQEVSVGLGMDFGGNYLELFRDVILDRAEAALSERHLHLRGDCPWRSAPTGGTGRFSAELAPQQLVLTPIVQVTTVGSLAAML